MKIKLSIFFLLLTTALFAQVKFDAKSLLQPRTGEQRLVNDFANMLTPDQQQALEAKLVAFDDSTSTQIAVVIVPNLDGYDVADYNVQLGRAWGVGGKEFNNGVVLLISQEDRKLNIATGYGAEGALPDVTCKHIIDEVIVPNFKEKDFYGGINLGTDAIIKALKGEYSAPEGYGKKKGLSAFTIIVIIAFILIILSITKGGGNGTYMSRRGFRGFMGPTIFPTGGGGGWGGGGSSGGGGFGGFGGGSFGGGGASGSW